MPTGPSHGQDITTLRGRSGIISNTPSEPEEGLEYLDKVLEKVATPPLAVEGGVSLQRRSRRSRGQRGGRRRGRVRGGRHRTRLEVQSAG